jgi:hypothetical protein
LLSRSSATFAQAGLLLDSEGKSGLRPELTISVMGNTQVPLAVAKKTSALLLVLQPDSPSENLAPESTSFRELDHSVRDDKLNGDGDLNHGSLRHAKKWAFENLDNPRAVSALARLGTGI